MKVNPFKTTLYSSVLLAGLAATSVAAADEAKDVTATTDTDATVSNTTAESSANLVKTTGDAAVVTTVPGTEEKTTTETDTTVKTTTKAIAEVSNPDFNNAVEAATTTAVASKDSADVKAVQDQAAKDAQEASNTVVSENKLTREEADAALTSAKANVVATGGFTATEEVGVKHTSVEAANNDNKVQTTALTTAVSEYNQKLADYKTQLDKYYQDVLAYAAWEKSYKEYTGGTTARLLTKGLAENATGLIYKTESNATMTVENSAGSVDYLDKTIQSGHSVDEILEQFNTSRYIPSDFSAANGTQYTINADGEYTEDVWLKMATGQTLTVTYNNLNGTSFNGTPVKKIVATYTLVETPSTDGSAIVKLYHDPTKTLFIGSQTDDTNKKLHVKMNLNFFDSESSVKPLDLSKNGSVLSISSLNHWNTELGNHIEKVGLNGNEYVQIPGSSITLHEDGYAYATNDNEFVANGSRFNSDSTVDPTTGEVTDEGWDAINPDGTPRTKNAYYGAAATIFKGEPMDFIVSGNNLNVPTAIELIFGKTLNGRKLQDKEFTFELKDEKGNVLETVKNDAEGKVKFSTINYAKADLGKTFNYTVEEVKGTDTTVTYDNMKVNVTVQVIQPSVGDQLSTVISYATVGGDAYGGDDRVFDNNVTPNFKPEKYVVSEPSFDIIGNKLADDDDSADKVEIQNLNGKTLKRGQKIYYQVWLDTRDFTAESNLQTVGITDNYEEAKLDIDASEIKVYDGITGKDVTDKFDIKVENGVLYGTSKASLTKAISATDATPVIDTTKFEFGRYYKFDIPAVVKDIDANDGVDIENTANQTIHQYNPFNKKVTTPEKPTQTRENNVPVPLEFNFTKRLEGRELTAGEFSFVLKDKDNKIGRASCRERVCQYV